MNYQPPLNSQSIMLSHTFWLGVVLKLRGIVFRADNNVTHTHCEKDLLFLLLIDLKLLLKLEC